MVLLQINSYCQSNTVLTQFCQTFPQAYTNWFNGSVNEWGWGDARGTVGEGFCNRPLLPDIEESQITKRSEGFSRETCKKKFFYQRGTHISGTYYICCQQMCSVIYSEVMPCSTSTTCKHQLNLLNYLLNEQISDYFQF